MPPSEECVELTFAMNNLHVQNHFQLPLVHRDTVSAYSNMLYCSLLTTLPIPIYLPRKVLYHIFKSRDGTKFFWRAIPRIKT